MGSLRLRSNLVLLWVKHVYTLALTRVHPGLNLGITRVRAEGCVLALTHNNTRFNHAGIYNVLYCPRLKTLLEGVLIQFWILLTCCFFGSLGFDRTIIIVYARKRPQVSENKICLNLFYTITEHRLLTFDFNWLDMNGNLVM